LPDICDSRVKHFHFPKTGLETEIARPTACKTAGTWSDQLHIRGSDKSLARPTSRCILFDG
jgi:hypothetical protein